MMAMESLIPTSMRPCKSPLKFLNRAKIHGSRRSSVIVTAASRDPNSEQQLLDLSVLRFTLGIPGLDESYLPRFIGAAFGSLIIANHFLSPSSPSPAQLRSEALGTCLAAFSTALPYLGKFLKGANPVDRSSLPEGNKQIFVLSQNLSGIQKEDLAWESYVLLRNTNTMSVAIVVQDTFCLRGYWNTPENLSKDQIVEWFKSQIQQLGFLDLKEALYFPQNPDIRLRGILPKGVLSLLVQPLSGASDSINNVATDIQGFVLLMSNANCIESGYGRDRKLQN
ncbi:uncharacterized protein A4U43_C10F9670 [Asparagus officinalis]|uniref:Protein COFACTOR ASSEMBLY OF COMPLEX C SUBUNIT B CCB2, chloroplastic n=1 Tax=Asparagus officinalis TaxID=4686 RepID=A0A5P1E1N0_ASPOF|nr:uncharacterized protein A4U43_C10F9670 [Asparagus officinalis]